MHKGSLLNIEFGAASSYCKTAGSCKIFASWPASCTVTIDKRVRLKSAAGFGPVLNHDEISKRWQEQKHFLVRQEKGILPSKPS